MTDPQKPGKDANGADDPGTQEQNPSAPPADAVESSFELPPDDSPEDYTLSDGSVLSVATDVEHFTYAENVQDRKRSVVPFAVLVTEPTGAAVEVECEDLQQAHDVHSLVTLLDRLGYRRG